MTNNVGRLVVHYDGHLTLDENLFPTYKLGKVKVVHCPVDCTMNQLKVRIHRAIKSNLETEDINLICKYPVRDTYIGWRVEDDDDCTTMMAESQSSPLAVYVEHELRAETLQIDGPTPNPQSSIGGFEDYTPYVESIQHDIPSTSQAPNVELTHDLSNTGYESMCSEDNSSSSDSGEDDLNIEDAEHAATFHSNVDAVIQNYVFRDDEWVSQLTLSNEYSQFARSAKEWDEEIDFDGHSLGSVQEIDFRVSNEIYEGMIFSNKWDLQCTVAAWSIINNVEYKKYASNKQKLTLVCTEHDHPSRPCPWRLHAVKSKRLNGAWKLSRLRGPHCCCHPIADGGHKQCTSKFICRFILPSIRTQLDIKPREIIGRMQDRFNIKISYLKAWDARRKAIKSIFGGWEESYRSLYRYMEAIRMAIPGTAYEIKIQNTDQFQRVFWSFGPCISGWVHCRPVISLDGTFLLGKYRGTMLTAVGIDANNGLFPLAFAVVESECNESWEWFLLTMREKLDEVLERPDLCIISDKHSGLLKGVRQIFPHAAHRHCLRHLRENFKKALHGMGLKARDSLCDKMYGAGNTDDIDIFNQHMLDLAAVDPKIITWLRDRDFEKWTLIYDGGYRYASMTTNASECYNSVLRRARGLPIQALISAVYYHVIGLFLKRHLEATNFAKDGTSPFVPRARVFLQSFERQARSISARVRINMNEFEVHDEAQRIFRIDVSSSSVCKCSCNRTLIYHMPCSHSIAALGGSRIDHTQFVSRYFTIENFTSTYSGQFHSVPDRRSWPPFNILHGIIELSPPPRVRRRGRPQMRRIKNSMDERRK